MLLRSIFFFLLLTPAFTFSQTKTLKAGNLQLKLHSNGFVASITNDKNHKEYLFTDTTSPILTLVKDKEKLLPISLKWMNDSIGEIEFEKTTARIQVKCLAKSDYVFMEIYEVENEAEIEAVIWGPFPILINKIVGEVIGVVRDDETAIGLQVLNVKTLGGDYPNSEGSTWERGIAAYKKSWGSTIQAYSISRNKPRLLDAWGGNFKNMPVKPIADGSIKGSSIALFACDAEKTLDMIENIELGENLPHPVIDGIWYKRSKYYGRSYLISNFSENELDEMILHTKRAGLFSLYHEGPFKSWGHFDLDSAQFPDGKKSLQRMAEKAHRAGLKLGIHTLTNFINTNDPYVTPVPDMRLSLTGSSVLMNPINENAIELEIASPEFFSDTLNNSLHTVRIGNELIRYKYVTSTKPFILMGLERGAFGTYRSAHRQGDVVGKLLDHPYNVFFPDFEMNNEVAGNLADLLNETKVDHIDFDGYEGGLGTGQGDFGVETFAKTVFDKMDHPLINGTSISKTFYWHIGSYYNWGEPWYGGFRESMQQYRIDNQGLFDRNFMPHMMGWYLLTENTTLPEMEWMLARASGYQAGFAMVARPSSLRKNPITNELLDAIREWENARTSNAFNEGVRNRMKDPKNEFHLEKISEKKWKLYAYDKTPSFQIHQLSDTISFNNNWITSLPVIYIKSSSDTVVISKIKIKIGKFDAFEIASELSPGQSLLSEGKNTFIKYDAKGKMLERITLKQSIPSLPNGNHKVLIKLECINHATPSIELQLKGIGEILSINGQ